MKTLLLISAALLASPAALADFKLANNGNAVGCYGEDNYSWDLNAKRTTVKFTVEGESLGAMKILKIDTDNATYVSYTTKEGTLTLSDTGDTYQFADDTEAWEVDCE